MADLSVVVETMEHRWMRGWVAGDKSVLKELTSRNFRLVMGSKPSVILDYKSWIEAAPKRLQCQSYRFGDIYVRNVGGVVIFATQLEMKMTMDGRDWSGRYWVTDLWRKSKVRRRWTMVERVLSRPEENDEAPAAIRSLQLWR